MLSESLRVPYRADDAFGTILVGSVLTFSTVVLLTVWTVLLVASPRVGLVVTPVVALPSLVMRGYLLAAVDSGICEETTVPSFVQWGSLVRRGSSSTLLSAIYLLPAAVLAGLAVGGWVAAALDPPGFTETAQALTSVLILISGFGLLIYGLIYLYVRPAARAVFAATGSLRAALRVRRVLRLSSTSDYLTGWLIAMGLLTVGPTVLLPPVGIAVAVGYLSPAVALIIMLVTILLGICLGFVIRVSAAWATGRGAATGLTAIYPVSLTDGTDETGVMVAADSVSESESESKSSRPEADPTVQTGRTVGLGPSESHPAAVSDLSEASTQSTPTEADGTGPASIDDDEAVDEDDQLQRATDTEIEETESGSVENGAADTDDEAEEIDGEAEETDGKAKETDDENGEPVDSNANHGFVWGVDDES